MYQNYPPKEIPFGTALSFLMDGMRIAVSPQCRLYILVPVLLNLVLLSILGYLIFSHLSVLIFELFEMVPDFLIFIAYFLAGIVAFTLVFMSCYCFSTIATIIASPFYGLLADKVELLLTGSCSANMSFGALLADVPRILWREVRKQIFFLPLALLCLVVTFIPVIGVLSAPLWFALTAWMGCLQYCDYTYDNHKISFKEMQGDLKHNKIATFTVGGAVALGLTVPVLNLLIPPAAVCAGTKYYLAARSINSGNQP